MLGIPHCRGGVSQCPSCCAGSWVVSRLEGALRGFGYPFLPPVEQVTNWLQLLGGSLQQSARSPCGLWIWLRDLVNILLPNRGCLAISALLVGSCCSIPNYSVFHAFMTPCHIEEPCFTKLCPFIIQFAWAGHFPRRNCLVCNTWKWTSTFHDSYSTISPLFSSLTRSVEACHCKSKILTPPRTMGRTVVSHFILVLARDTFFPDHMYLRTVAFASLSALPESFVQDAKYQMEDNTTWFDTMIRLASDNLSLDHRSKCFLIWPSILPSFSFWGMWRPKGYPRYRVTSPGSNHFRPASSPHCHCHLYVLTTDPPICVGSILPLILPRNDWWS